MKLIMENWKRYMSESIVDAPTEKLSDVMKLKVRNFSLKDDKDQNKLIGFIAQEVEQVFPSIVTNTELNGEMKKAVKESALIPILVKAIQELSTKLTALEAKVGAQ